QGGRRSGGPRKSVRREGPWYFPPQDAAPGERDEDHHAEERRCRSVGRHLLARHPGASRVSPEHPPRLEPPTQRELRSAEPSVRLQAQLSRPSTSLGAGFDGPKDLVQSEFPSGKLGSASQMRGTHGWAEVSAERKR